jgi:D-arabinose 1-dehydrogenase-like Zn-dependent alcohol dehydrogenase
MSGCAQGAYGTEDDPAAVSTWRRQGNTLTFPRIQGTDTVGHIVGVGEGVDRPHRRTRHGRFLDL